MLDPNAIWKWLKHLCSPWRLEPSAVLLPSRIPSGKTRGTSQPLVHCRIVRILEETDVLNTLQTVPIVKDGTIAMSITSSMHRRAPYSVAAKVLVIITTPCSHAPRMFRPARCSGGDLRRECVGPRLQDLYDDRHAALTFPQTPPPPGVLNNIWPLI